MSKENRQFTTYVDTVRALLNHDIQLEKIAHIALDTQQKYEPDLTPFDANAALQSVLKKRDIQQIILIALELDDLAAKRAFHSEAINDQIQFDDGLFGVDEALAFSIVQMYGPIAMTNYGDIDRHKPGLIGELDKKGKESDTIVTTFADDIVRALAACTAAKMATRSHQDEGEAE